MKEYLNEGQQEDELVKIIATDWELIVAGANTDRVKMPKDVVPLSQAIDTIEEFLAYAEPFGWNRRSMEFYVHACKDDFLLFTYDKNGIAEDHRKEERPKNPEKVYFIMRDGGGEKPRTVSRAQETYAEFAVRDMEKMLGTFDIDKTRRQWRDENLQKENIYFDVYKNFYVVAHNYMYSYKDGKKYIRPLTEKEEKTERSFDRYMQVRLKMLRGNVNPPRVLMEYEIQENRVEYYMNRFLNEAKEIEEEAKEQGEEQELVFVAEDVFFETYDRKTGALLKRHRIVDGKIVEDTPTPSGWDSLPFMKKGQ